MMPRRPILGLPATVPPFRVILLLLAVLSGVASMEPCDILGVDGHWLPKACGEERSARDVFAHNRGLDRLLGRRAHREDTMILHNHCGRSVLFDHPDHLLADLLPPDRGEAAARDRSPELVGHCSKEARNRESYRGPRCRIRAMGMHYPLDLRHLTVDVTMRSRVGRRLVIPLDYPPLAVHNYHGLGCQVLVLKAAGLNNDEAGLGVPPAQVSAGPGDQIALRQLLVQNGDLLTQGLQLHGSPP